MKKEDTPSRIIQRRYEATRKEWRKETTAQFNTRLPRKEFEEIETFLKERHLRKLDLIYEGYFSYLKKIWIIAERRNGRYKRISQIFLSLIGR